MPHPIFKLANDTETPLHYWNNKQLIFDSNGNKLGDELADRLSTTLWEIIADAFKLSENAHEKDGGKDIPSTDSLQDFIRRGAAEVIPNDEERQLLVSMSEMFGAYVGEPVWKQSLRFAWMEECCGGGTSTSVRLLGPSHSIDIENQRKCLLRPTTRPFSTLRRSRLSGAPPSVSTPVWWLSPRESLPHPRNGSASPSPPTSAKYSPSTR